MPLLRELQLDFGRALLGGNGARVATEIVDGGVPPEARLAIYRHHVLTTLSAVLKSAYPVVCRLVDERFFAYAADHFVRRHPPSRPCLTEYGSALPDFLAGFEPCRHLAYLPDVARLEWAIHVAHDAEDAVPLTPASLADLDPSRVGDIVFRLDPSMALIASCWPIETIWRAHQSRDDAGWIRVDAAGQHVQVCRRDDDVDVRPLPVAVHGFRRALLAGARLADAVASATAEDSAFDVPDALHALFQERLLIAFTLPSQTKEEHS
jgi:hypothetical protein